MGLVGRVGKTPSRCLKRWTSLRHPIDHGSRSSSRPRSAPGFLEPSVGRHEGHGAIARLSAALDGGRRRSRLRTRRLDWSDEVRRRHRQRSQGVDDGDCVGGGRRCSRFPLRSPSGQVGKSVADRAIRPSRGPDASMATSHLRLTHKSRNRAIAGSAGPDPQVVDRPRSPTCRTRRTAPVAPAPCTAPHPSHPSHLSHPSHPFSHPGLMIEERYAYVCAPGVSAVRDGV